MIAHVAARVELPYVSGVCSVAKDLAVAEQVVKVARAWSQMDHVLVAIGEAVLGWLRHAALLSPDDAIQDDPPVIDRGRLHPTRYPGKASPFACMSRRCSERPSHLSRRSAGQAVHVGSRVSRSTYAVGVSLLANLTFDAVVALAPVGRRREERDRPRLLTALYDGRPRRHGADVGPLAASAGARPQGTESECPGRLRSRGARAEIQARSADGRARPTQRRGGGPNC